jgi:hypothetical protein
MAIGVVTLVAIISRYDDVSLQSATRAAGLLAQGRARLMCAFWGKADVSSEDTSAVEPCDPIKPKNGFESVQAQLIRRSVTLYRHVAKCGNQSTEPRLE